MERFNCFFLRGVVWIVLCRCFLSLFFVLVVACIPVGVVVFGVMVLLGLGEPLIIKDSLVRRCGVLNYRQQPPWMRGI